MRRALHDEALPEPGLADQAQRSTHDMLPLITKDQNRLTHSKELTMSDHKIQLRKQISIFLPLADWKAIRLEAARQKIPMTELCRRWMKQDMEKLRTQQNA